MWQFWSNLPRLLRDLILIIIAVLVIIAILLTSEPEVTMERVMKMPRYFRGKLQPQVYFKGPQNERQTAVVAAFKHAWKGYKAYAWGYDNLKPVSMASSDWFGLGMTIVDSISTILVMDLHEEFEEAKQWVQHDMRLDVNENVSLFEVTIRVLGGLLSAYHLSGEQIFLTRAVNKLKKCQFVIVYIYYYLLPDFSFPS